MGSLKFASAVAGVAESRLHAPGCNVENFVFGRPPRFRTPGVPPWWLYLVPRRVGRPAGSPGLGGLAGWLAGCDRPQLRGRGKMGSGFKLPDVRGRGRVLFPACLLASGKVRLHYRQRSTTRGRAWSWFWGNGEAESSSQPSLVFASEAAIIYM
jgi:hypothetical protein